MLPIRAATVNDVALLKALILELAEYERERDQVMITEADLVRDGFGPQPKFRALIAEWDGQAAGYALFFGFYSTWEVLDWNQPAIDFYKRLGATFLDQWKSVLLTGDALERAAAAN